MRRTSSIVAAVVVAAAIAGCSATTDSSIADTTTTVAAPTSTAPSTSSTEASPTTMEATTTTTAGPPADIVFGFGASTGDPNAIRNKYGAQGLNQTLDGEVLSLKIIDDINANGGLSGHKITPLLFETPSGDIAGDVLDQQRCEFFFGGKVKANVVWGDKTPILNTCAAENNAVVIGDGLTGVDAETLANLPTFVNAQAPDADKVAKAMVELGVARKVITSGTKVGVLAQSCPDFQRVVDSALTPALEAAGATVTAFSFTCVTNSADQGKAVGEIPAAVLQMKSADVSVVINVDRGFIGTALIMNEASSQGLTPTWLVSTSLELGGLPSMSPPADELATVLAVGWSPLLDTNETDVANLGKGAQDCIERVNQLGFPAPANLGELAMTLSTCTAFLVMGAMVAGTPGAIDSTSMLASLATTTDQISLLAGSADWSIGRQPVNTYRPVVYDPTTQRFKYDGDATPFPS